MLGCARGGGEDFGTYLAAGSYASPLGDDDPASAATASKPGSTSHQRRLGSCVRGLFLQNSRDLTDFFT
jgi:hypothetical protein